MSNSAGGRGKTRSGLPLDWGAIERDYTVHGLTVTEIAKKHGTTDKTIRTRASKEQWARKSLGGDSPIAQKIRRTADEIAAKKTAHDAIVANAEEIAGKIIETAAALPEGKTIKPEVAQSARQVLAAKATNRPQSETALNTLEELDNIAEDAVVEINARVQVEVRQRLTAHIEAALRVVMTLLDEVSQHSQAIDEYKTTIKQMLADGDMSALAVQRAISLSGRVQSAGTLVGAVEKLNKMMRQAYNIDVGEGEATPLDELLLRVNNSLKSTGGDPKPENYEDYDTSLPVGAGR